MNDKFKRYLATQIGINIPIVLISSATVILLTIYFLSTYDLDVFTMVLCVIISTCIEVFIWNMLIKLLIDYKSVKNNDIHQFTGKFVDFIVPHYHKPIISHVFKDDRGNEYELVIIGFERDKIKFDSEKEFTVYYTKKTKYGFIPELNT